MKKIISAFILLATSGLTAVAQPVLTSAQLNPVAGDKILTTICDISGVSKGSAGAAVTWNFSTLVTQGDDSLAYLTCTPTAFCDSFPGSNLSNFSNDNYQYYMADANRLAISGVVLDNNATGGMGNVFIHFTNPHEVTYYPMIYNGQHVNSWNYYISVFGTQEYGMGVDSFSCDGFGTLILPTGTFNNALRIHVISVSADSSDVAGTSFVQRARTEHYWWYVAGLHAPILALNYDTSGTGGNTPQLTYAAYNTMAPVGIAKVVPLSVQIAAYPNPCIDKLTVDGLSLGSSITISDITGRTVIENADLGANAEFVVNTSGMVAGMYMLSVRGTGGQLIKTLPFVKQ